MRITRRSRSATAAQPTSRPPADPTGWPTIAHFLWLSNLRGVIRRWPDDDDQATEPLTTA